MGFDQEEELDLVEPEDRVLGYLDRLVASDLVGLVYLALRAILVGYDYPVLELDRVGQVDLVLWFDRV
jgi:hypothetical protein